MKTNSRYIMTTLGVAAGLFAIGATANALSSDTTATAEPIGSAVVLPSASADASASPEASPSLVQVEYAENSDTATEPVAPAVLDTVPPAILGTGGWTTSSGGAGTGSLSGPGGAGDDEFGDDPEREHDNEMEDD